MDKMKLLDWYLKYRKAGFEPKTAYRLAADDMFKLALNS